MLFFCEKCEKIVPKNEVMDFSAKFGEALKKLNPHAAKLQGELGSVEPSRTHVYKQTVNAYKNQRPDIIGCCLVQETVWCGKVREPTDYEYFLFETCKANARTTRRR